MSVTLGVGTWDPYFGKAGVRHKVDSGMVG